MPESTFPLPPGLELDHPHDVWIIQPPRRRLWVHVILLLATFASTTIVGTHIQANFAAHQPAFAINDDVGVFMTSLWDQPSQLLQGLWFSLTLLVILMAHEMGHYLYALHYRVYATLPYFIPFPSLIGTLGAFIRIKSPIPSRSALFDIGVAGPIAGFVPACIAVFSGLALSQPLAASVVPADSQPGFPLFFDLAARVLHIGFPLSSLSLHPIAAAGWVGVFATSLNLLPGGQLDGGHIFYAAYPKLHRVTSLLTVFALLILTKYCSYVWLLWAVVLWLTSYHPHIPDRPGLSPARKWVATLAIGILVVSFTPAPLTHTSGREVWPAIRDGARDLMHSMHENVDNWRHRR